MLGPKLIAHLRDNDDLRQYKESTATAWATVDPSVRMSSTSHIFPKSSPEADKLFRLVNIMTRLDSSGNPLRLYSYTPGGHFSAHSDSVRFLSFIIAYPVFASAPKTTFFLQDNTHKHLQQALIATFMFYVSEIHSHFQIRIEKSFLGVFSDNRGSGRGRNSICTSWCSFCSKSRLCIAVVQHSEQW